jgi:hypothetical protein
VKLIVETKMSCSPDSPSRTLLRAAAAGGSSRTEVAAGVDLMNQIWP